MWSSLAGGGSFDYRHSVSAPNQAGEGRGCNWLPTLWDELARQAFVDGGTGPLDVASGSAGAGRSAGAKLQRDMTAQLEQGRGVTSYTAT